MGQPILQCGNFQFFSHRIISHRPFGQSMQRRERQREGPCPTPVTAAPARSGRAAPSLESLPARRSSCAARARTSAPCAPSRPWTTSSPSCPPCAAAPRRPRRLAAPRAQRKRPRRATARRRTRTAAPRTARPTARTPRGRGRTGRTRGAAPGFHHSDESDPPTSLAPGQGISEDAQIKTFHCL